jgi:serine/threonine protein kinase
MILPTLMSGSEKKDRMAIMEAAISSSLSHTNVVNTYTYSLVPVKDQGTQGSLCSTSSSSLSFAQTTAFEVQIVQELCDRGNLRSALNDRAFFLPGGTLNYKAVLETAADMARGMAHLHSNNILHSDLKVPYNLT